MISKLRKLKSITDEDTSDMNVSKKSTVAESTGPVWLPDISARVKEWNEVLPKVLVFSNFIISFNLTVL
jgi:hypothetical protein